jgi:DNA-binding NtrC family response regulator
LTTKTVLIVDDDAEFRNNLEDILEDEGYASLSAGICSEA